MKRGKSKGRLATGDRSSRTEGRGRERGQEGGDRDRQRAERELGGGQGAFKREHIECTQEVLLVPAAEDTSYQNPKVRAVHMSGYSQYVHTQIK